MLSSVTKSHQLVQLLESDIAEGRLSPGDAVPSQNELARRHGVAVGTVRDAFSALEHRGLLQRVQGKGTFVTEKALAEKPSGQSGVFAVMFQQGMFDGLAVCSPQDLPYYGLVFKGMEARAREMGLDICLCPSRSEEIPRLIRERRVDGVIMLAHAPQCIEQIQNLGIPVVAFRAFSELTHSVTADDYDAASQVTRHLLDLGHRQIAFLGVDDLEKRPGKIRLQGYLDTMRAHGIEVPDEWVDDHLWMPHSTPLLPCVGCDRCAACVGWETMKNKNGITAGMSELPFTALICYNDTAAMGVIARARADGFDVPRDLSVVGFDDISCNYHFTPQITSVDFSLRTLGEEAVSLIHAVAGAGDIYGSETEASRVTLPVRLAVHGSTRRLESSEVLARRLMQAQLS